MSTISFQPWWPFHFSLSVLTHIQLETTGALCMPTDALDQYPECWWNIHCTGLISYRNITFYVNNIRKLIHILKKKKKKKMTQLFKG